MDEAVQLPGVLGDKGVHIGEHGVPGGGVVGALAVIQVAVETVLGGQRRVQPAALGGGVLLLHGGDAVIDEDIAELAGHNVYDGVPQAETGQEQGGAARYADHRHEQALLVAEEIAGRHLGGEVHTSPQGLDTLQQNPFARLGRLGPHELGRGAGQFAGAGKIGGEAGTQQGGQGGNEGVFPVEAGDDGGHVIHDAVGPPDHLGEDLEAHGQAQGAARHRGQHGVEHVFARDGQLAVTQGLEGADLSPLLLHHAGHGGQTDQGRHQEEENREHLGDVVDALSIRDKAGESGQGAAVEDIPLALVQFGKGLLGVGDLSVGVGDFLVRLGFLLVVLLLAVSQLLLGLLQLGPAVLQLDSAVGQLLFRFVQGLLAGAPLSGELGLPRLDLFAGLLKLFASLLQLGFAAIQGGKALVVLGQRRVISGFALIILGLEGGGLPGLARGLGLGDPGQELIQPGLALVQLVFGALEPGLAGRQGLLLGGELGPGGVRLSLCVLQLLPGLFDLPVEAGALGVQLLLSVLNLLLAVFELLLAVGDVKIGLVDLIFGLGQLFVGLSLLLGQLVLGVLELLIGLVQHALEPQAGPFVRHVLQTVHHGLHHFVVFVRVAGGLPGAGYGNGGLGIIVHVKGGSGHIGVKGDGAVPDGGIAPLEGDVTGSADHACHRKGVGFQGVQAVLLIAF